MYNLHFTCPAYVHNSILIIKALLYETLNLQFFPENIWEFKKLAFPGLENHENVIVMEKS